MRFVLLLITSQFLALALAVGDGGGSTGPNQHSLKAQHPRPHALSVFFEENKTEKEGEDGEEKKFVHRVEIADLSYITLVLNKAHAFWVPNISIAQLYDLRPPLFKMHCIFVI